MSVIESRSTESGALLAGFAPVVNTKTRVLILGSFPGTASLDAQQYYAHPRNQFWRLLSAVVEENLTPLEYDTKLAAMLQHNIGLWDVIAVCEREGSLDSAIRQARSNDFTQLKKRCPELRLVAFNGKTSARYQGLFAAAGFQTLVLPSSSPAYAAMNFAQKLALWRGIVATEA